jgi:MFS family permease
MRVDKGRDRLARDLAIAGFGVFLACLVCEHLLAASLNPARHEISEYVHTRDGWIMTAGFIAWAISLATTAVYAWRRQCSWMLTPLLGIAALGMVLTACFPSQTSAGHLPTGVALTTTGRLHDIGSGAVSVALLAGAVVSASDSRLPPAFRRWAVLLVLLVLLGATALLIVGPVVGGIRQRLLVVIGCLWQLFLLDALGRAVGP